jgi:nitrogen PTS system EIIA component
MSIGALESGPVATAPRCHAASALFAPERIALGVPVADKATALAEIGRIVQRHGGPRGTEVARWLARREAYGSTALGAGSALAHAHLPRLPAPLAVYLRPRSPIAFDAPDGLPVSDLVALLVPRPATAAHFELLLSLRRRLRHPALRRELARSDDPLEVSELLSRWCWA